MNLLKKLDYPRLGGLLRAHLRELAAALTLLATASCVPLNAAQAPASIAHAPAAPIYIPLLPAAAVQSTARTNPDAVG